MIKVSKWYRLDNAAKIFPPSKNKYDSKIFRFTVSLVENVDKDILNVALTKTLQEYPIFRSVLKRGLFWYYLEESNIKPVVVEEHLRPCSKFDTGLLFQVTYYKKRINLEVNHALTDGTGTLMFLKTLVVNYLEEKYKINSKEAINKASIKESSNDSFRKYYTGKIKKSITSSKIAYKIKDEKYVENRLKIIEGIVDVNSLLKLAKKYNVTLTVYLVSLLIKCIGESMELKARKKPIVVTVPVNLRNYYPSYTVRNFFNAVNISFKYNGEDIANIIKVVNEEFKRNLTKENVENKMNNMAKLEDIFILRLIPIFIKDLVLRYAYKFTENYATMTLSNIGIIDIPEVYQKYIDYFDVFISTSKIQLCMCSYLNKMLLTFTSQFVNSEIEKNFFRYLTAEGINVTINTNKIGGDK
mgnify:CR=1 FL=1